LKSRECGLTNFIQKLRGWKVEDKFLLGSSTSIQSGWGKRGMGGHRNCLGEEEGRGT